MALLLPLAVIFWLLSVLLIPADPEVMTIRVTSQVTGEGIEGAAVTVGTTRYVTDTEGTIRVHPVGVGTPFVASAVGYESARQEVNDDHEGELTLSLNGILVIGSVRDAISGEAVVGADISAVDSAGDEFAINTTDNVGGFVFKLVPEDAHLRVEHEIYGSSEHAIEDQRTVSILLMPPPVSGRIVDEEGSPVTGVVIAGTSVQTMSDVDGRFELQHVGQGAELSIVSEDHGATTIVVLGTDMGDVALPGSQATPVPGSGGGE